MSHVKGMVRERDQSESHMIVYGNNQTSIDEII